MARFTFTIRAGNYGAVRMAAAHAPAGGISIGGKQFKGGEFIPGEVVDKATAEEKRKLGGESKPDRKATAASRKSVVAELVRKQVELGADPQRAEQHINTTVGRTFTKLDKQPWQRAIELTAKDRRGREDIARTSKQLNQLKELGAVQVAWDISGNPHWALARDPLPKELLTENDVEVLEKEGWTEELAKKLLSERI